MNHPTSADVFSFLVPAGSPDLAARHYFISCRSGCESRRRREELPDNLLTPTVKKTKMTSAPPRKPSTPQYPRLSPSTQPLAVGRDTSFGCPGLPASGGAAYRAAFLLEGPEPRSIAVVTAGQNTLPCHCMRGAPSHIEAGIPGRVSVIPPLCPSVNSWIGLPYPPAGRSRPGGGEGKGFSSPLAGED